MFFRFKRGIAGWLGFAWLMAMAGGSASTALEPATPLNRLGRQAWTMENGLPQNTVPVLLQSHDGFLWAGTELGLARFDGVSFRIFDHATEPAFPDAETHCLLDAGTEGGLWIGTSDGLIRWKNGNATRFTSNDGLPDNFIQGLAQSSDGTVWMWTQRGLARWTGEKIQAVSGEKGLPGDEITSIAPDVAGGMWIGTSRGVTLFRDGHWQPNLGAVLATDAGSKIPVRPARVKTVANGDVLISNVNGIFREHDGVVTKVLAKEALPADEISFLDLLSDGTISAASKSSVVLVQEMSAAARVIGRFAVSKELPGSRIESMYADRNGCLWIGTSRGLARISISSTKGREAREAKVHLLPPSDPLASNAVISLMEDREGDLWAGTEAAGLHILRDTRFRIIGTGDGLSADATTAVAQDAKQVLWVGTRDNGLNRISETADSQLNITGITTANGLLSNVILSLAAAGGDLWIGTPDGLSRLGREGLRNFTSADGLPDDFIRSLLVAPDSSLWIGTRRGLTHMLAGKFQNFTQADGLGSNLVGALAQTANGDLWIATLNGLSRLHEGKIRNYTTSDGLSSNVITALDVTRDGTVWIGTQDGGLNLWDGQRFARLSTEQGGLPSAIHGLMHDDRSHLWLASDSGLTRVALAVLLKCGAPSHSGPCALTSADISNFTTVDGLRSRETSSNSHPTICRANDGKLWFTTPRGVIVADPLHFPSSAAVPPIAIERVAVDDRDIRPDQTARITAGTLRFQFDYAGLSFAAPQKVRYQYMLEGFDHGWTDAGTRRTAYYTNISPGTYRFRVRALGGTAARSLNSSASDKLNYDLDEASQSFELLPHYYQTIWFRTLIVLMIAALVALAFRLRVLRVEREFRAVMAERNRIAREIHDTLAQGYVGISLQLEILGELLRHNRTDAAQKHLALTQEMVREGLNDARQSIWALRSQDSGDDTLPIRLRRVVEQSGDNALDAGFDVHGAYRALATDVEQEILRVAQEAIQNVKKHAAASRLSVRLDYDDRAVELTVEDDGKGFAQDGSSSSEGHYGLTGMRERSELIRGTIQIASVPGNGTTIRLNVPATGAREKHRAEDAVSSKYRDQHKEQQ